MLMNQQEELDTNGKLLSLLILGSHGRNNPLDHSIKNNKLVAKKEATRSISKKSEVITANRQSCIALVTFFPD